MSTLEQWLVDAKAELGIDIEVDVDELLDMTKVVAHNVARPAAPLTAFLVGYAAAQAGGDPKFTALPTTWLNGERWEDDATVTPLPQSRTAWDRPFVGEPR